MNCKYKGVLKNVENLVVNLESIEEGKCQQ